MAAKETPPEERAGGISEAASIDIDTSTKGVLSQALTASAVELAGCGISIFPVTAGQKSPPLVRYTKLVTNEVSKAQHWWDMVWIGANVAIRTSSTHFVVDIDDDEALAVIRRLEEQHGKLPMTWAASTPRRGSHIYLRAPEGWSVRCNTHVDDVGIDIRGHHGYVLAPPSRTAKGSYTWEVGPTDSDIAEAPLWLMSWLEERGIAGMGADFIKSHDADDDAADANNIDAPGISEELLKDVYEKYLVELHETQSRNPTWFDLCCQLRDNGARREQAEALIDDYLRHALIIPKADKPTYQSLRKSLKSAFNRKRREAWNEVSGFAFAPGVAGTMNGKSAPASAASSIAPPLIWTAQSIYSKEFEEQRWAVEGLLPECGLAILASSPKVGKSWLALQLGWNIADGTFALGSSELCCSKGNVLGIFLEDSERRLNRRLRALSAMMGGGVTPPDSFELSTSWKPLAEGAMDDVRTWAAGKDGLKVVIIDTIQKLRGVGSGRVNAYHADYHIMGEIQRLALELGVLIIGIHHTRKGNASDSDVFESVSGSHGITGAGDVLMVLKRPRSKAEGTLSVTGRDIGERDMGLILKDGKLWRHVGTAEELLAGEDERALRTVASESEGGIIRIKPFAESTGRTPDSARKVLARFAQRGVVLKHGNGRFELLGRDSSAQELWANG